MSASPGFQGSIAAKRLPGQGISKTKKGKSIALSLFEYCL
jgi:hypothetical protein